MIYDTLDPSMADFLHIDSPEGILLVVDEDGMPTHNVV